VAVIVLPASTATALAAKTATQTVPIVFFSLVPGTLSLSGRQWLFLAEGLPACILAFAVYRWMPDGPADASWLDGDEKATIASCHHSDAVPEHRDIRIALKGRPRSCKRWASQMKWWAWW
jgi:hypothetical protein